MIKLISNFKVNSITLETTKDTNSGLIFNKASVSTSITTKSTLDKLKTLNVRIFISLGEEASTAYDFVSQRYNEYMSNNPVGISSHQLNEFVQRSLKQDENYLKSSVPFSPFSTDLETRNLAITNRVSKFGNNKAIPQDTIIYDAPITEIYQSTNNSGINILQNDPIVIDLPPLSQDIKQMSLYAYVYDTRIPKLFNKSPENNFSINTGMTMVNSLTPVGNKTVFLAATREKPLVGMVDETTLLSPNSEQLRVINVVPQDAVNDQYKKLEKEAKRERTAYRFDRNYELNKIIRNKNYFSDLWLSTDSKNNCKFIFAFDIRSFLRENGIYRFVYESDVLARAVISGGDDVSPDNLSSIIYTKVSREPVHRNGFVSDNSLGTTAKSTSKGPNETYPGGVISDIKKDDLKLLGADLTSGNDNEICFYQGVDDFGYSKNFNLQSDGAFAYSAELTIIDKSPTVVRNLSAVMLEIKRTTNKIYSFLIGTSKDPNTDSVYNPETGLIRQDIRTIEMILDGKRINVYSKLLDNIRKYQYYTSALASDGLETDIVSYYENSFQSSEGRISPKIIKDFEDLVVVGINFLEGKLKKVAPRDPYGNGENVVSSALSNNTSKSVRRNILIATHTFSEVYDKGKLAGFGVDYVFDDKKYEKSIKSISLQSYDERRVAEFKKYFSGGKGSADILPDGSYEDPSYSYLTPFTISTPNRPVIEQTKYATDSSLVVEYDYDRYGQLFSDMLQLNKEAQISNNLYPTFLNKSSQQSQNNKLYASISRLLSENFSLKIDEVIIPQFNAPKVSTEKSSTTVLTTEDLSGCGPNAGLALLPSVIGGEAAQSSTSKDYLKTADRKIKNENTELKKGDIDERESMADRKERAIRLPIAILGELSLDKELDLRTDDQVNTYNSLTALGSILDISQKNIAQALESAPVESLPNQLKSMLVISSTNDSSALGVSNGGQSFDACRPRLKASSTESKATDLISFYGTDKDVPPYPQTEDPMKSYSQFLTFWMNYKKIGVVEYLQGFGTLKNDVLSNERGQKLKLPTWSLLNASAARDLQNEGGSVLCRVRSISVDDYLKIMGDDLSTSQHAEVIKFFETRDPLNIPTYNKYFYIQSDSTETNVSSDTPSEVVETTSTSTTSFVGY